MLASKIRIAAYLFVILAVVRASPSSVESCKSSHTWSVILKDYLVLAEEGFNRRVGEWWKFSDANPNMTEPNVLAVAWEQYTSQLPLADCLCDKSSSAAVDGVDYIPPALFVDYPILGVIVGMLLYLLRMIYGRYGGRGPEIQAVHERHVFHAGDYCNSGPELLR